MDLSILNFFLRANALVDDVRFGNGGVYYYTHSQAQD